MIKGSYKSVVLFFLIAAVIVVRIIAEPTSYVSPDSTYYLSAADHLIKGEGLMAPHPEAPHQEVYFAIWPAGYPLCIAGFAWLSGTSVLVASKMVNLFFLGLTFVLLFRWFGEKSWLVALYFCCFGMLEVYSYSWSEAPFLFFVLLLCYFVTKDLQKDSGPRVFFQLFFCLAALFLFRYAGLIYYVGLAVLVLYLLIKKQRLKATYYLSALFFASILVGGYLLLNKEMTGYYTGIGDRVQPQLESLPQFAVLFIRGVWNQASLARQYFGAEMDYLYLTLLMIQLGVMAVLFYYRKKMSVSFFNNFDMNILLAFGLFYFVLIVVLRKFQPFDAFDYRIMAPFSLPMFVGLLARLTQEGAASYLKKVQPWIVSFMLLSLLVNLPKQFLMEWVRGLF